MKTKRFDFNWKPLRLHISFTVEGSVPGRQNYSTDTDEYAPDYTLTPLILQPHVSIPGEGDINHALANIRWSETIYPKRIMKQIALGDADYEITTSGDNAGRIKVKKNAKPKIPITLAFYAEYADEGSGQIFTIQGSYIIKCDSASDQLRVELDAADQTIFNPLSDPHMQTVKATVWKGLTKCEAGKYALVWEVQDGNVWRAVGSDDVMDYDTTVNADGSVTVNRQLMGGEMHLRCRVKDDADGSPEEEAPADASPQKSVSFVRRIPRFEFDFTGVPYNIPEGTLSVAPTAIIRTTDGKVEDAEKELLPLWYVATNKAKGSLSYSLVAHGLNPVIPTSEMDGNYGAVIGLDVADRGCAGAFTDATDDAVFCDADGAVLIIH